MIFKLSARCKKFTIISSLLMGFLLSDNRSARTGAPNDQVPNTGKQVPSAVIAGQSQTPASTAQTSSQASESRESESQNKEGQNAGEAEKKPLKEFKPTEKIDADQAVDFPYDI